MTLWEWFSFGELLDVVDDLFAFCCNGEIYIYIYILNSKITVTDPVNCSVQRYLARCIEHPQPMVDRLRRRAVDGDCMAAEP
jgi:hypothetical protein